MWEELKVYRQLDKKEINSTFKKFGREVLAQLDNFEIEQTSSMIKLFRVVNELEQAIFIEKSSGSYDLQVRVCIKPLYFYIRHKFTMVNIVSLGDIMKNHRRSYYPLTQEWQELSFFLAARIKNEIEGYFSRYDSFEKIIENRKDIESNNEGNNKYDLLIYAAIKTKNKALLTLYIDKKINGPAMRISQSEFLKPSASQINVFDLLKLIKKLATENDFDTIETQIHNVA